ncbi:SNF2-related protein [Lentisphaera profundi]|uniref:SNF2-related protein n=1 Tax=Lentisphaera profundi TaxID=1658616 RepID=A0ABY7VUI7_9BACT|nr:DEAD/DEAH box helicase [Lentisphaera profundi]WDE97860.1 SNF2-related protein [Lentisphaera profundi]
MKTSGEKWLVYKMSLTQLQVYIIKLFAMAPQYFTPFHIAKILRDTQIDFSCVLGTDLIKDEIKLLRELEIDVFSFSNNFSSLFQKEVLMEMLEEKSLEDFYLTCIGPHLGSIRAWDIAEKRLYLRYFYLSGQPSKEMRRGVNFYSKTLIKPQCEGFDYTAKINPGLLKDFWYEMMADDFFTGHLPRDYSEEFKSWIARDVDLQNVYLMAKYLHENEFHQLRDLVSCWEQACAADLAKALDCFFKGDYREASRGLSRLAKEKLDKWSYFPSYLDEIYLRCLALSGARGDRKILESRQMKNSQKQALLHLNEYRETAQFPPSREVMLRGVELNYYKALRLFMEKRKLVGSDEDFCWAAALNDRDNRLLYREWLSLFQLAGFRINENELASLEAQLPFPSFVSFLEIKEAWESGLDFIEKFFSPEEQSRLIWRFTLNEAGWDLRPFEQKQGKSGWLKGKQISFDKVQNKTYLSELDKQILAKVVYQTGSYVEWSGNEVLELVAKHPLLYDLYDLDAQVSLEVEEGGICLDESDDFFILDLPDEYKSNVILKRTDAYKYKYYRFPECFEELQQYVTHEGLKIPKSQGSRIRGLLPRVSQYMPVMSNWRDENTNAGQLMESFCDIRVIAEPMVEDEGINFRLRVPVFGSGTPEFTPGEGAVVIWKDGKQCLRDVDQERLNLKNIMTMIPDLPDLEEDGFLSIYDQQQSLDFLMALHEKEIEIFWPKKSWSVKQLTGRMSVKIEKDSDWFKLSGEAEFDGQAMHFAELFENLSKDGAYVKLSDERFVKLSSQLKDQIQILKANLGEYNGALGFSRLGQSEIAQAINTMPDVVLPQHWDVDLRNLRKIFKHDVPLPEGLNAELRTYQLEGFQWLSRMAAWGAGACLADDMGLGKTMQALGVLLARAKSGPSLVVAPTSVCSNWEEEITRFAPQLKSRIYESSLNASIIEGLGDFDILLCSYTMLQRDLDKLKDVQWNGLVLDEAQAIKNPMSGRSKAARALSAKFKIATTGTPVENHPGEIWALFDFLNPGYLGNQRSFGKEVNSGGMTHAMGGLGDRLRRRVQPFILRRMKKDVLKDLPERTDVNLRIKMGDEEQAIYNGLRARAAERLGKRGRDGQDKFFILEEITRLRQAACSPGLLDKQFKANSAKVNRLLALVEEIKASGNRALVFSQFTSFLDIVQKALDQESCEYLRLDGSTPAKKRQGLVNDFQQGDVPIFLISLKAGGFGLNLTAANYVIHMDPWWNPAVEDQATDRVHRIGQDKAVTVYRLISEGSIEEKILDLHGSKREFADFLLGGQDTASKMSADELLRLLK